MQYLVFQYSGFASKSNDSISYKKSWYAKGIHIFIYINERCTATSICTFIYKVMEWEYINTNIVMSLPLSFECLMDKSLIVFVNGHKFIYCDAVFFKSSSV
jgi:hypothetical protein